VKFDEHTYSTFMQWGVNMILNISSNNTNVIERGVYYFGLSDFPHITKSELKKVVAFVKYEKSHGRQTEIVCLDEKILAAVNEAVLNCESAESTILAAESEYIYHATDITSAQKILSSGKLLSAEKVYGKSGEELSFQKQDSLWNDPADYFQYIMFCWGDSPIGDYVVLSEDFPCEEDLLKGKFNPGIRFYFRYEDIIRHPRHIFDGYHPVKVKDEIILADYLFACIVSEQYRADLDGFALPEVAQKIHYLFQDGIGLAAWNNNVYDFVREL